MNLQSFYNKLAGKEIALPKLKERESISAYLISQLNEEGEKDFFQYLHETATSEIFDLLFGFLNEVEKVDIGIVSIDSDSSESFSIYISGFDIEFDCEYGFTTRIFGKLSLQDMQHIIALIKPRIMPQVEKVIKYKVA